MAIHLIIDGYNLIRQSPFLSKAEEESLEEGRHELLDYLYAYKKAKGHRLTVVFDAADEPTVSEEIYRRKGVKIVFSRKNQTADDVIKHMARSEGERAVVVTSDRDLASTAERFGAKVVSSQEFEGAMIMAYAGEQEGPAEDDEGSNAKFMTRKKGPAKRLSKKERKSKAKLSKL